MKKLLLLFTLTVFVSQSFKAQVVFCAPGAVWKYYFFESSTPGRVFSIYYIQDSIIGSETVKVLGYNSFFSRASGASCVNRVLIRQRGDTVFMRNCNTLHTWQILYNFAATAGQTWTTSVRDSTHYAYPLITHTIVVNAVTTVTVNGMSLKKLFVSYCYDPGYGVMCGSTEITERMGCGTYLFNYYAPPPPASDYDNLWKPLCYKDDVLGTVNFEPNGCNYYTGISENELFENPIHIYPQPAHELVTIDLSNSLYSRENLNVILTDLSGREVKHEPLKKQLDLSGLNAGLYLLKITDDANRQLYQTKLVKQN